jgi:ABC transport system ATP-binding/permease protein
MAVMGPEPFAFPLTVLVGSIRYVFAPGRDVTVGYGQGWDIPLDGPANPSPTPHPEVVLRFAGNQWVAVDRSPNGILVDGYRVPTVNIRDGQAITIGDPQRGPRLIFHVGAPGAPPRPPAGPPPRPPGRAAPRAPHPPPPLSPLPTPPPTPLAPPPPPPPSRPGPHVPTEQATRQMRVPPPPRPPVPVPPSQLPPAPPAPPPPAPPEPEAEQPKDLGLIEQMTTRLIRDAAPAKTGSEAGGAAPPEAGKTTYRLPLKPGSRTSGLAAYRLKLDVGEHELLKDVSFTARPGTLTAVVGPSATRNSALLGLLAGIRKLTSGRISIDGHDVAAEPESMRSRIGIVGRGDRMHPQLTVERVVGYAAELRLPPDTLADHRRRVVDQVLEELQLTPHRATRIGKLSPELRRCASMAIELVTRPTVLVVDEPGAGLDEEQENHVMAVLRRQADIGCVVVVSMNTQTSLTHLDGCDQVVLLTPAGTMAFAGPPSRIESALGTADWSEAVAHVVADPDAAHRAFRARQPDLADMAPLEVAAPWQPPTEPTMQRQFRLVARRQLRLLFADRAYLLFLVTLPFALAGLTLLIPGTSGLDLPPANSRNTHQAVEILASLNFAAVLLGSALSIRDLVRERRVFRREQAVGLSASAYLAAKIVVFGVAAAILTAILTAIVLAVKGQPKHGAVLLGNADVELYVSVAATAIVSVIVGLALSALGNSLREVLLLLVPVILASLLFAGGLISLVGTWVYDQISWFVPAQWGFAASASTADLRRVDELAVNAQMWTHYVGWWMFDMILLAIFGAAWAGFARYRLRPTN